MADSNASDAARRRLALAERRVRELEQRVDQEVRLAQRALEETLKARQERDEYRRVLAAALANEKQALSRAEAAGTEPHRHRIRYHALFAELRIATLGAGRIGAGADLDAEAPRRAREPRPGGTRAARTWRSGS